MYNHQLNAFIKTADLGSFGKAAEAMYISSPAIIQQVNLLESRCGLEPTCCISAVSFPIYGQE
ncbi:LysR family transcriptional regulator [Clostridiales bacterium TF09-2AC]|uniref:LysR family transcriptional regulator n=1 Tax=Enterocloster hominis (ex Hitch et al. 2024) TaxID=1917870 RepID=UPI0001A5D9FD|nr:hypothetical protein CBFG_00822 [Clostridiales bacterium 1_7_47FAA]RJW49037.1 LysR family transcriptional regulator [Clostridiales bacterium TF09-2AC]